MKKLLVVILICVLIPSSFAAVILTPCDKDEFVCEDTRFYGCEQGRFEYITTCDWGCNAELGCLPAPDVGDRRRQLYGQQHLDDRWVGEQVIDDRNPSLAAQGDTPYPNGTAMNHNDTGNITIVRSAEGQSNMTGEGSAQEGTNDASIRKLFGIFTIHLDPTNRPWWYFLTTTS